MRPTTAAFGSSPRTCTGSGWPGSVMVVIAMADSFFFIWAYEDPARGLALLRGREVPRVLKLACVTGRWSVTGRGMVVPLDTMPDIAGMAEYAGVPYRIKQVDS